MRAERAFLEDEAGGAQSMVQIGGKRAELRRHARRPDPDHLVALDVLSGVDGQPVMRCLHVTAGGNGLVRLSFAEKGERQMDILYCRRPAAGLLADFGRPLGERARRVRRRPQRKEKPHYSTRCLRISAASAVSPCSPSAAMMSSISRRPRFCESFQRASMRVTGI